MSATLDLETHDSDVWDVLFNDSPGWAEVEIHADICSGQPVFRGTRIPLTHIVALFARGVPVEEIVQDYPGISIKGLRYAESCARMGNRPQLPSGKLALRRT